MEFLRQVFDIAHKDVRAELRTKEGVNASLAFALVVVLLLFSFAFDPESDTTRDISGVLLGIAFAFAGALILNRSFARELPNDCLDGLIAAPISGAALFLGKALATYALVLAVELVSLPVSVIFCYRASGGAPLLLLVCAGRVSLLSELHVQRAYCQYPAALSHAAHADLSDTLAGFDGSYASDYRGWFSVRRSTKTGFTCG